MSAKKLHAKYEALLAQYKLPDTFVPIFEDVVRKVLIDYNKEKYSQCTMVKKQLTEVEEQMKECEYRYGIGKIADTTYNVAMKKLNDQKGQLVLELDKYNTDLSNLMDSINDVVLTCSNLGSLWGTSTLETKRKIQNLVYPHGILWDKKKEDYRTFDRNEVFDLFERISATYGNKKEEELKNSSSFVPLCE